MPSTDQAPAIPSKIQAFIQRFFPTRAPIDPATFADPLAQRIPWTPAKPGGSNFCTHRLVEVDANRLEFRPTIGARLFGLVFLLAGLAVMILFPASSLRSDEAVSLSEWIFPVLFGLVFAAVGGGILYAFSTPIVFDKYKGAFWKSRKGPDQVSDPRTIKRYAPLGNIHALQILSEYCSSDKSSYYSYELNLVLNDTSRINVVDHGNLRKLREDATRLSQFLGKPLWDAMG